jgi:DNA-binding LacI/PurR family transcriptional regulator
LNPGNNDGPDLEGGEKMIVPDPREESRRGFKTGEHQHGKVITMSDIAKASGVSQGAISSLLNDRDYGIRVSEKTREKVFKTCREMGYMPNDLRAVVRMYPELGELCFLADSQLGDVIADPFFSRVISGAMNALQDPSHPISIARFSREEDFALKPDLLPHPIKWGTASKFVYAGPVNTSLVQAIVRRGFPIAIVGGEHSVAGAISLLPNYAEAGEKAIGYLCELGHKNVAIMSGPFGSTELPIVELTRGVRVGLDKAGISLEGQNIVFGEMTPQSGYRSMEMIFSRSPKPTSVFCFSDTLAVGAIAYAQSHGLRVPEDISVIGCGDDRCATTVAPALTTIHLPAEEMGAQAVQELESRVRNPQPGVPEPKRVQIPVGLVERESCAKAK